MRTDTNKIALRVIRGLLEAARPFELEIGANTVTCSLSPAKAEPWPTGITDLDEQVDGPWPVGVHVDCRWGGRGACRFHVGIYRWPSTRYLGDLCVQVQTDEREVVFVNVSAPIRKTDDGRRATLGVRFFVTKRKSHVSDALAAAINAGMRDTLAESRLPILGDNTAELAEVEVPAGTLAPAPDTVFHRLIQLALLKLDFIDRSRITERGAPLVDLTEWLPPDLLRGGESDDVEGEEVEEKPADSRQYWAGGFTEPSRLEKFKTGNYWQIGYKRNTDKPAGKKAWKLLAGIKPGDHFAIKGLGGKHDLAIHYVGRVLSVDADEGRLQLEPLSVPLYKGKGPTGTGAGNWQNTLVPVTLPHIIQMIFGVAAGEAPALSPAAIAVDVPLNLILYGPPGTGKTHELTSKLVKKFRRTSTASASMDDLVDELSWTEVTALALHDLGGKAKVAALREHPLVRAKYASKPIKDLNARLRAVLQGHTISTSKTVNYTHRSGMELFDKKDDAVWILAIPLPEELQDHARRLHAPAAGVPHDDYRMITFHQAYGYEDFIEGIRPRLDEDDEEGGGQLSYQRADGVFLKAARAALRLSGYNGSLHDFCGLTKEEREKQFEGAPHYAVFIDEINRGNVARIFGELITLLEDDKRLGEEHEVIVELPYSKQKFGVPPNLHVIGTMNTADRSIEALDTALRRRFDFKELPPLPELLDFDLEGDIELDEMLRAINRRLEKLYDRDHCIGHAYLYALRDQPTLTGLKRVFRNKIIPLLQEYFHGDWGKIGLVLGEDFVRRVEDKAKDKIFAKFKHDDREALGERATWELRDVDELTNVAFQRIYKDVPDA